jgi:hypothetical protein
MSAFVIDENVLIVAEVKPPEPGREACLQPCIDALREAMRQKVVLDDSEVILSKYSKQIKKVRQNGMGMEFWIWLIQNQHHVERCERVKITPLEPSFAEVPLELQSLDPVTNKIFDLDDHIWLAAAKASANNPTILNATDKDWYQWQIQLEQHGFQIKFLCPYKMTESRA